MRTTVETVCGPIPVSEIGTTLTHEHLIVDTTRVYFKSYGEEKMSDEKISVKIPHFDGSHYDHWSELMENLLRAKGLWNLVETGIKEPNEGVVLTN